MAGLASALTVVGSLVGGVGAIASGAAQSSALKAQADAAERAGHEQAAAAQREALQRQKEAKLVLSRQQAVAAASGGSATDTTVLKLMGDTAAQGQYNSQSAIYEGKAAEAAAKDQAAIDRMQARSARVSGFIDAGGTLLSGLNSYLRYKPYEPDYATTMPMLKYG